VIVYRSFFITFFREKIMRWKKASAVGSVLCILGISSVAGAATIAQYDFDTSSFFNPPTDSQTLTPDNSGNGFDLHYNHVNALSADTPFTPATSGDQSIHIGSADNGKLSNRNMDFSDNNSFTIEGWIKPGGTGATANIAQLTGTGSPTVILYLGMITGAAGTTNLGDGYGDISVGGTHHQIVTSAPLDLNAWNYLALTYDGSSHALTLYALDSSSTATSPLAVAASTSVTATLPSALTTSSFIAYGTNVSYDDVRISNTVLSDADLGYHASFTATSVPEPASLSLLGLGGLMLLKRRKRVSA